MEDGFKVGKMNDDNDNNWEIFWADALSVLAVKIYLHKRSYVTKEKV